MNQLASLMLLICDYHSEKKQEQIWLFKDLPNPVSFLAEVLHIISTFSTCPAVLQIHVSRTSECLMTQRHKKYKGTKKVEFCLSPVYSFTAKCKKNLAFSVRN